MFLLWNIDFKSSTARAPALKAFWQVAGTSLNNHFKELIEYFYKFTITPLVKLVGTFPLFVSQDINQVTEEQLNTWTPTWKQSKIMKASQMIRSELVDVPVCFFRCQKSNFTFTSSGLTHTAVRMRVVALHTMWMKWRMASFWLWWSMMRDPTTWRNLPRRASQVWAASTSSVLDSGELQKYCIVFLPVVKKIIMFFPSIHKLNDKRFSLSLWIGWLNTYQKCVL